MTWRRPAWTFPGHPSFAVLDGLARGELEAARERVVQRHVARCEPCRERLDWVRRLPSVLAQGIRVIEDRPGLDVVFRRRRDGERVILPR